MINKVGVRLQITRQGSLATVSGGRTIQEKVAAPGTKNEFVYFATKAIAGDQPNGNGDYFPWDHLLKSYATFVGRSLFLNHNSSDPRNAIGKVLDAYPVVDDQTGEKYIECLAKIDAVAHPELARQIESGILDSCSMGCSVESSQCSICAHTIYSDQDNKCRHMSTGLGKEYIVEADLPECGIKKGSHSKAFAVNRGLNFTELSVVNVPAWDNAKIVQVIAQLKDRVTSKAPTAEVLKDLEDILTMASQNDLEAADSSAELEVETKKACGCTSNKECAKCKKGEKALEEKQEKAQEGSNRKDKAEEKALEKKQEKQQEKKRASASTPCEHPGYKECDNCKAEDKKDEFLGHNAHSDDGKAMGADASARLTKLFKEKLSALDFLDLQAFMKKANGMPHEGPAEAKMGEEKDVKDLEEAAKDLADAAKVVNETLEHEKKELAAMPKTAESKKEEKDKDRADEKREKADDKREEKAEKAADEKKEKADDKKREEKKEEKKAELESVEAKEKKEEEKEAKKDKKEEEKEAKKDDDKDEKKASLEAAKLKAIFVAKSNVKDSYWVVTADGKPVLKASLSDIWGDKIEEVSDYAASPTYGEALLQRLKEDGVKKVALLTNATIYTEAADSRGQVGKGDEWPSQRAVGNSQYKPAAPMGHAKMKKSPEGVDMSGGDTGAASAGPTGGKGDTYPTSKSTGRDEYKLAGGGGPKVKTEKATYASEDTTGKIEVTAEAEVEAKPKAEEAPVDEMPLDMPTDMPPMDGGDEKPPKKDKKDDKEDKPKEDKKDKAPKGGSDLEGMSAEELVAHMMECAQMMAQKAESKGLKKPVAAVEKAVEKVETIMTKEQEAAAKEAEAEAKVKAKEDEKAAKIQAKEDEKAAKIQAKEDEKAAKAAEKAEKDAPKEEEAEANKDPRGKETLEIEPGYPKKDEAEEAAVAGPKKDEKDGGKGPDERADGTMKKEATVEIELPGPSDRELELEAQLAQLKLEQSLRAKAQKCQAIVSEMVEKDMVAADEADIQAEIADGKPLFDARASAFKKAIDKQCADLLAMEEGTLKAFAMTVSRVKGRTIPTPTTGGVLKKAFRLQFDEHTNDDAWIQNAFDQMGSQKGRKQ